MATDPTPITASVCCIVVNYNGVDDTLACLAALARQDYLQLRVFLVDNASRDDSIARIRTEFPDVEIVENAVNLGFARAVNIGLRHALGRGVEYAWLLNNDTLPPPDTCTKLVAKAASDPRIAIIGSVLHDAQVPTRVLAWGGGRVNRFLGRSRHMTVPFALDSSSYLTFASVLLRLSATRRVGLLNERMFLYWEDADLSLRIHEAGLALAVAEDTAVPHKEGATAQFGSPQTDRYSAASALHFLDDHSPLPRLSQAVFILLRVLARLLRGRPANAQAVLAAVGDYRRQR